MANKTLGDYVTSGTHEMLAFVHESVSHRNTIGNDLGRTYFGVIVCSRQSDSNELETEFFYKNPSGKYKGDSDICHATFGEDPKVLTEIPLSISTHFFDNNHLKNRNVNLREARQLLARHGLNAD